MRKTEHETQDEKKKPIRSLSVNELLTKGNEYMQQAKMIIKKDDANDTSVEKPKDKLAEPFRYKNYLVEMRSSNTE